MFHTARRRKREERRRKIGLKGKVEISEGKSAKSAKQQYKDEPLDLSKGSYGAIVCDCFLAADRAFSASMATVGENHFLSFLFHICEVLGNGMLWIGFSLYLLWSGKSEFTEHVVNFLYGLLLDIVVTCTIKALVKRKRPEMGEKAFDLGPDQYSFPSGHASRAVFIACFLTKEFKFSAMQRLLICVSCLWFILTRVWLGRHYLSDVCAGAVLGSCVYAGVSALWITRGQIQSFKYFFSYVFRLIRLKNF